jgi:DNA-binding transcriptional ArsR family regulator
MDDPAPPLVAPDLRRQLCRLGGQFVLDRGLAIADVLDRNFITALLFIDIVRFNTAGIMNSRPTALQHLTFDQAPPDSLRIPVSVYALARDLNLPYETARRHVRKLKDAGLCVAIDEGLIIPSAVLSSAEARDMALRNLKLVRHLIDEAARFGVVAHGRYRPTSDDVIRQVGRLSSDYFVEAVQLIARELKVDATDAMVFLTIAQNNTVTIRSDARLGGMFAGLDAIPPDDLRDPVSVYFVSRLLKLPYETTRRATLRLTELGLLTRVGSAALIVPSAVIAGDSMVRTFGAFAERTFAFLCSLAEYGLAPAAAAVSAIEAKST